MRTSLDYKETQVRGQPMASRCGVSTDCFFSGFLTALSPQPFPLNCRSHPVSSHLALCFPSSSGSIPAPPRPAPPAVTVPSLPALDPRPTPPRQQQLQFHVKSFVSPLNHLEPPALSQVIHSFSDVFNLVGPSRCYVGMWISTARGDGRTHKAGFLFLYEATILAS